MYSYTNDREAGKMIDGSMPVMFYEEYEYTWKDLQNRFRDIDWSINCPALIRNGEVRDEPA